MKMRILIFEDEAVIRGPLSKYLRGKGHEVLDFPSPVTCPLLAGESHVCHRDYACADLVITDMNMPGMTGLEMVRRLAARGCLIPPQSKIVISSSLTPEQEAEFRSLGCHFLPKPFQLNDLWELVRSCENHIAPDRELAPIETLMENVA